MSSDILLYRAELVPVGEDQLQHLELTREIARRWNRHFGEYFPEPQGVMGSARRIRGLDGSAKMSKSRNNTVGILDEPDQIEKGVRTAVTDPQRIRRQDPGRPEVCNVYTLHGYFTPAEELSGIESGCRSATLGCVDCKRQLAAGIADHFEPMRERAAELRAKPELVLEVLGDGAERCRRLARETLREVRDRMGFADRAGLLEVAG